MKKLLGSMLALAIVLTYGTANAELLKNLQLSGQIDVQASSSRNVSDMVTRQDAGLLGAAPTFNDRVNDAHTRLLVGIDWDLLDDVHARVQLAKRGRTWGTASVLGQASTDGTADTIGAAGPNFLGTTFVNEAYVKIAKIFGHVDATIGRQTYGEPGDLIVYVGPSDKADYGLPTTAADLARVDIPGDWISATGIAGKMTGSPLAVTAVGAAVPASVRDIDVQGLTLTARPMENLNVHGYVYRRFTHNTGALGFIPGAGGAATSATDNLYVYGARAKYNGGGLSLKFEFAKNSGESRRLCAQTAGTGVCAADFNGDGNNNAVDNAADAAYNGWAWKFDGAYTIEFEDIVAATPWLTMGYGTGRSHISENENEGFQSITPDFRPGTIYGRFSPTSALPLGVGIPCFDQGGAGVKNALCSDVAAYGGTLGTMANVNAEGGRGVSSNGLNNRVIWGVGGKFTPAALNKMTVGFSFWDFRFQKVTDYNHYLPQFSAPTVDGFARAGHNGQGNGNKHIGNELDLDATWQHSDNVRIDAGVAGFRPGKYIQSLVQDAASATAGSQVGVNPTYMAYADLRIKF